MARRRMIDPNFWQSEDVSKLSVRQRLLFIGLFSNADDEGKLRGNPAFVRSIIFPYEDFAMNEIEQDLNDIEGVGSILQYNVEGSKYILLCNWKKFQRVDKPQSSVIPDPNENYSKNDSENESENDSRLKERKGKEIKGEEDRGREEPARALLNIDQQKDYLRKLCTDMKIQNFGTYQLDIVYSYIGMAEIEVIEAAIKKSENKPHTYLTNTLHGMINVDKILKADQLPGAKAGDNNGGSQEGVRQGGSTIADKPITGGKSGILPSKYFKVDENGELQVSGL